MMKKLIIIASILLFLAVSVYIVFNDSLPPRTPHKIARQISSLDISNEFEVEDFKDNLKGGTGAVPSGDLFIKFALTENQLSQIQEEAQNSDYKKLPIVDFIYTPEFVAKESTGYYKLEKSRSDPSDFKLVVISLDTKKMYIYFSD